METVVHLIITGIISLVPLLDGSYQLTIHGYAGHHGNPAEVHYPTLLVEEEALKTSEPRLTEQYCSDLEDAQKCAAGQQEYCYSSYEVWRLHPSKGAQIEIETRILEGGLDLHDSFSDHLLELHKASPDPGCAFQDTSKFDDQIISMNLKQGELLTALLSNYEWKFRGSTGAYETIARELCFRFTIEGEKLKLRLPGASAPFEATVVRPKNGGDIELRLQNVVAGDILPIKEGSDRPDHHVGAYFERSLCPGQRPVLIAKPVASNPVVNTHGHRLAGDVLVKALGGCAKEIYEKICEVVEGCQRGQGRNQEVLDEIRGVEVNCPPGGGNGQCC